MTHEQARQQIDALREQIEYHNKKYYTEDAPEISDYAYDMLYRRLENLEAAFPELKTEDSPTNRVGAAGYNTFAEVTHTVPMESLHDSFSEDELRDFDRRVRAVVDDPVYVVEPKFDGLFRGVGIRERRIHARLYARRRHYGRRRDVEYRYDQIRTEDAQRAAAVFGGARRGIYVG